MSPAPTSPGSPRRSRTGRATRLVALGGGLLALVTVLVGALTASDPGLSWAVLGFAVWAVSPFAALVGIATVVDRRLSGGRLPLLLAGVAAGLVVVGSAVVLASSESSTAALALVWGPAYAWVLVVVGVAAALGVHLLRRAHR